MICARCWSARGSCGARCEAVVLVWAQGDGGQGAISSVGVVAFPRLLLVCSDVVEVVDVQTKSHLGHACAKLLERHTSENEFPGIPLLLKGIQPAHAGSPMHNAAGIFPGLRPSLNGEAQTLTSLFFRNPPISHPIHELAGWKRMLTPICVRQRCKWIHGQSRSFFCSLLIFFVQMIKCPMPQNYWMLMVSSVSCPIIHQVVWSSLCAGSI